jgi:predicted  nucleic acid-binding Zn-ribbon protein
VSGDELRKQAVGTLETAKKFTEQQKGEYQKKIESELTDLGKRIGELKERAETAKSESLAALQVKIADLRERQKTAENKLGELKSATAQAWTEIKDGLDRAVTDLRKSYENAAGLFK